MSNNASVSREMLEWWLYLPMVTLSELVLLIRGYVPSEALEEGAGVESGSDALTLDMYDYLKRMVEREMARGKTAFSKEMHRNSSGVTYYRYHVRPFAAIGLLLRNPSYFTYLASDLQVFLNEFDHGRGFKDGRYLPCGRPKSPKKAQALDLLADLSAKDEYRNRTAPVLIQSTEAMNIWHSLLGKRSESQLQRLACELRNHPGFLGIKKETKPLKRESKKSSS